MGAAAPAGSPRSGWRRALLAALFAFAVVLFVVRWMPTAERYYELSQPVQSGAPRPQFDFFQYYAAGTNWRLGLDPYSPEAHGLGAMPIPRSTTLSGFIYPPLILPALAQLSRLGYDSARALWLALSLAALLCPLVLAIVLAGGRRWELAAVSAVIICGSDPVLFHIRQGQIDMIVSGLAVTAFLLYGRLGSWPSALLFAVAVAAKLTPAVLVVALAAYTRDWRLPAKTLAAGLALIAVSLLLIDPHLYVRYVSDVLPEVSAGNPFFHNQSLLRGWSHTGALAKYASLSGYALVVAAAAVAGRRRPPAVPEAAPLPAPLLHLLAFAVTGILLFSPLSWRMAFVWSVVPMALVLAFSSWAGHRVQLALVAAGTGLMCLPLWDRPFLDSLETIGAVLAGAGLLWLLLAADGTDPAGWDHGQRHASVSRTEVRPPDPRSRACRIPGRAERWCRR